MTMKPLSRWAVTGLACLLLFAALAAFKVLQIRAAIAYGKSFPEPSESVEAVTTELRTFRDTVSTIGEITAPQSLELRNEEAGTISAVNFQSGDRVHKDDILVQLDVREERARLQAAQARVKLAELDLKRVERLIKQKTISEESVDQAEANAAIARADVLALEAIIARKTVRAPFDAVAGLHTLEVGEFLQSNTPIVSLLGVNAYTWVDFHLPLARAAIDIGGDVSVKLSHIGGDRVPATVIARNPVASSSSRTIQLRARIDNPPPVPPNTVVEVIIPVGSSEQIVLPRTALQVDSLGDYVYVLEPDADSGARRAKRRQVTVGYRDEELVGIKEGLAVGEQVASRGAFKLVPNMLTYIRERPGAGGERSDPHAAVAE